MSVLGTILERYDFSSQDFGGPIMSNEIKAVPQVQSVADPAPLGLAAFGLTTFVLSAVNAGLIPKPAEPVVLGVAFAYGGLARVLCRYVGVSAKATAFTSYAAFWIAFALLVTFHVLGGIPPEARPAAVGTFLLAWGIFTAYMTVAAITFESTTAGRVHPVDHYILRACDGAFTSQAGLTVLGDTLG